MTARPVTRGDLLTDLADAINELVDPRDNVEYVEVNITEARPSANGRRKKAKRTRRRRAHHVRLPCLLDSLAAAMIPGATGEPGAPAGFESRPSAETEAVALLRSIRDDAQRWARKYAITERTLPGMLRALVSASHTDDQLGNLLADARAWVHAARLVCGYDEAPITLNEPCPYCFRRHALVITGDLQSARCTRCHTAWSPDTIGLLADMITANETAETMPQARCWMADCVRRGPHDAHEDDRGHVWPREARCIGPDGQPTTRGVAS